jgi:hypothetical protein
MTFMGTQISAERRRRQGSTRVLIGAPSFSMLPHNQPDHRHFRLGGYPRKAKYQRVIQGASAHVPDVRLLLAYFQSLAQIFRVSFRVPKGGEHAD